MNQGNQGYSLTKKTEGRKSRDTVYLSYWFLNIHLYRAFGSKLPHTFFYSVQYRQQLYDCQVITGILITLYWKNWINPMLTMSTLTVPVHEQMSKITMSSPSAEFAILKWMHACIYFARYACVQCLHLIFLDMLHLWHSLGQVGAIYLTGNVLPILTNPQP
jgi:hypothetical protein